MHFELRHERVGVRRLLERHQLGQGFAADHDAGGVRRGVAGDPFELLGEPDQAADGLIGIDHLPQLGRDLERLLEPDAELVGDRLGDPVHLAIAETHDPPDIPDRGPGEHRAERDDLRDVVGAVLAGDVVDDLVPAAVLEVHVDVGHRHPVGVEEPLEGEAVQDWIDRRDPEGVGHDRPRGAAATGRGDPLLAREPDEVRHDQEVAGVAHREDHAELVVEPRLELRRDRAVAAFEAGLAFAAQPALDRLALGDREMRDPQDAQRQGHVHHLGDPARVEQRLAVVGEERRHLGRGLQVELVALELHPAGRVEVVAGADAEQDVVRLALLLVDVVQVVRDDEGQAGLGRQAKQLFVEAALLGEAVVLQLEEEAVLAEDVAVLAGQAARRLPVVDLE